MIAEIIPERPKKYGVVPFDQYLKQFEREYRTRLRSYLESHLRDLDSRGSAEPEI